MAAFTNKRIFAAVNSGSQEEHLWNKLSREPNAYRLIEKYIAQVSEEIEGRVNRTLSQEVNRIESQLLIALQKLEKFLMN